MSGSFIPGGSCGILQKLIILGHQNGADLQILSDSNGLHRQEPSKIYFSSALHTLGRALTVFRSARLEWRRGVSLRKNSLGPSAEKFPAKNGLWIQSQWLSVQPVSPCSSPTNLGLELLCWLLEEAQSSTSFARSR